MLSGGVEQIWYHLAAERINHFKGNAGEFDSPSSYGWAAAAAGSSLASVEDGKWLRKICENIISTHICCCCCCCFEWLLNRVFFSSSFVLVIAFNNPKGCWCPLFFYDWVIEFELGWWQLLVTHFKLEFNIFSNCISNAHGCI